MRIFKVNKKLPDHFISSDGFVWEVKKGNLHSLNPIKTEKGYLRVEIKGIRYRIHKLVAECFIPNPQNLPEINHKDTNKSNNNCENLEWCTHKHNMIHAEENNCINHPIGEKHGMSKLTKDQVKSIREEYKPRIVSQRFLAKAYGVSQVNIKEIVNNRTWKNI